jgi:hypothetical protein
MVQPSVYDPSPRPISFLRDIPEEDIWEIFDDDEETMEMLDEIVEITDVEGAFDFEMRPYE